MEFISYIIKTFFIALIILSFQLTFIVLGSRFGWFVWVGKTVIKRIRQRP